MKHCEGAVVQTQVLKVLAYELKDLPSSRVRVTCTLLCLMLHGLSSSTV